MKTTPFSIILVLAFLVQACNLPSAASVTETPTLAIPPSATLPPPTEPPTLTPPPTDTPPPTLSPTPSVPTITTLDKPVNCRLGPGTSWLPTSALNLGQSSQIVGKTSDLTWWYIQDPINAGRNCWVAASVTSASGNLSNLPVVQTPTASVTNVTVSVDPKSQNLGLLCLLAITPIKIKGTIETNGPTLVKWHFETQQGGAQPNKETQFDTFGTKEFSGDYTPVLPAGSYWVRLVVTSPNGLNAETKYTIECV